VSASVPPPVAARYADALARRRGALAALDEQIAATLAPPPPRLLLVEDDPDSGEMLLAALRAAFDAAGRAVYLRLVAGAAEACEAARREAWAAAVVDLHLGHPRLSGLDVVAALPRWTPVVIVSGTVPEALPALAGRIRASAHFEKPVDVARLADCLGALLEAPAARR
jgi:CheY-like chemotaxis protein